ncbi:GNAT family N-acetyltransferase [Paenibacillus popilliae]|uniref:GNAT family N-acetyltransferase n=1 Tax=Paenibacillus popilliae TaxID=78057 RepID=A0ABY3AT10_PAEPP|nr:GNAT family protein [Paenibacillus sp. SDF0028]TQR45954.1 GNAT family N-acetyltransferase [Paenibacillus sp. SDF0028]
MNIRVLQESDAQAYQELRLTGLQTNSEAFGSTYERESNFTLETIIDRVKPSKDKFVMGAFDDEGTLIGMAAFVRENGMKTADKGNLFGMYVREEMRGKGVSKNLLLALITRASEIDGVEQINLTVVSSNEPAKRLYSTVGFQIYGIERRALKYNGQYFDEDWMVLQLR